MIQVAIQAKPRFGLIQLEQARFTPHETLPVLEQRFPGAELVFLFGADVVKHIAEWPNVADLAGRVTLLIALRANKLEITEKRLRTLCQVTGQVFRYEILQSKSQNTSSSGIRSKLRTHESTADVPPMVMRYIHTHRLYR